MPLSTTQCLAKLRGVQAKLEASLTSLRAITHDDAQTSSGASVCPPLPAPLDAEYESAVAFDAFQEGCDFIRDPQFQQHGTDPQWIADQVRKMEGQV